MSQTFSAFSGSINAGEDIQEDMDGVLLYLTECVGRDNFNRPRTITRGGPGRPRLFTRDSSHTDQNMEMDVDDVTGYECDMECETTDQVANITVEHDLHRLHFSQNAPVKTVSAWKSAMSYQNEYGICLVSDIIGDGHSLEDIVPLGFSRGATDIGKKFYGIARTFNHIQIDPVTFVVTLTNGIKNIQLSPEFR